MAEQNKKINQIPLKGADTREEQVLLGFLDQEAKRIGWGQIMVEFKIQGGRVTRLQSTEESKTLNLGDS